jgi:hypothetical protein
MIIGVLPMVENICIKFKARIKERKIKARRMWASFKIVS